jgi:basic amino acid/polyamine antiporter, APA family
MTVIDKESGAASPFAPTSFKRKASGLMRSARARDVFSFNVLNLNIGIGVIWVLWLGPSLYPGANLYLSILLALLSAIPIAWMYAWFSSIYPRSGGDYVYVSRSLKPAVGFAVNFALCAYLTLFVGIAGLYTGQYGLGPMLTVAGASTKNSSLASAGDWLTHGTGAFLIALVVLVVYGLIMIVAGMKVYFRIQTVTLIIGMITLIVIAICGFVFSRGNALLTIDAHLANIGGGGMAKLAVGKSPAFSWGQTLHAAIWPFLIFVGAYYSAYIGGEVRQPAKSQIVGIMGALGWCAAWMLLLTFAMLHLFGLPFFANLGNADPTQLGFSSTPAFAELIALSFKSGALAVLLMLLFTVWGFTWLATVAISIARAMFAWAIDGVMPRWLAKVHPSWHTPYTALLVVLAAATVMAALLSYTTLTVLSGTVVFTAVWTCLCIAAILLPYRQTALWKASPVNRRILGVPAIVVLGIVMLIPVWIDLYLNLTDAYSGTSISTSANVLFTWIGFIVGGGVIYYVARAVQMSRGTDIDLSFQEIPPE